MPRRRTHESVAVPRNAQVNQPLRRLRRSLDDLYERYNRRAFVHPDPLEFLFEYPDPADREIVGLLAASMAYGRVAQILRNVRALLGRMGPSPLRFLRATPPADLPDIFAGFRHRWTTGREVADLLACLQRVLDHHGSLQDAFVSHLQPADETVMPALSGFVQELRAGSELARSSLLPAVEAGGACKRLHLYLRWMVRRDQVDPGGWDVIPAAKLIVPLDTHMHRLGQALGLCTRRQADRRAALLLTAAFRAIRPDDPVRYDFALTRMGIRAEFDEKEFLARCRILAAGLGDSL